MKAHELRAKSKPELEKELVELCKESFNLRMQNVAGQMNNTSAIRQARRDIARLKTIMREQVDKEKMDKKS